MKTGKITCAMAREMDMVDYLAGLGIRPVRIRGANFWYHSPFRDEKEPSFKINRNLNRWYDFGEGCGGNLIDFAIRYSGCTVGEFLRSLNHNELIISKPFQPKPDRTETGEDSKITVIDNRPIFSPSLLRYLGERRIPFDIADAHCREIHYELNRKKYYAIGFENDSNGFELRNPFFKGSVSPKDIRTIASEDNAESLCVFEGFFDFLSFLTIIRNAGIESKQNYQVLNSIAFFEKAVAAHGRYDNIELFLDNDQRGRDCVAFAKSLGSKYEDRSLLYKNHKDLNDFLCNPGNILLNIQRREDPT